MSAEHLLGPITVTVMYLTFWYYLLFLVQSKTKKRLKKEYAAKGDVFNRYSIQDGQMLAADRVTLNTQEQMVPFLAALWLHALFVSPTSATVIGLIYLALRSQYRRLVGPEISYSIGNKVQMVTLPCYALILYMLFSTLLCVWV